MNHLMMLNAITDENIDSNDETWWNLICWKLWLIVMISHIESVKRSQTKWLDWWWNLFKTTINLKLNVDPTIDLIGWRIAEDQRYTLVK